jgi:CDGSH-type Zn-finger protein/truncated hemoglobin YjbI
VDALARQLDDGDDRWVAERLESSVIRPLDVALGDADRADGSAHGNEPLADQLRALATDATRLGLQPVPGEVREAIAALQDLACTLGPAEVDAELRAIQASLPSAIQLVANGPYVVINVDGLKDWLGQPIPARPTMALCRCGESTSKPFCDGTHARSGFSDAKDPNRVPDRRDTYIGQQVTILDNRGICQHAGYCTDRLASVFHAGEEPFVTPSGGRMDEIIRAVRDCPSGALSFAIDGREAREQVDHNDERPAEIEVTRNGPYRIVGGIPLRDADGNDEPRAEGASLEHYALCRCGHSQNKPFCSGMHWNVGFEDPVPDADRPPTLFEWCGGLPALTRMTRLFYEKHVPGDPLLGPLFASMSPDHPQRVAKWLAEVFGGPKRYSEEHGGYPRMLSQHVGKGLTEERRARWVELISKSAQEAGLPNDPEFRSAFSSYIEWGSRLALENSQAGARPPERMPMPRWDWGSAGPAGSRVSALASPEGDEPEVALPDADEPVHFERHIRPLFRQRDRQSMQFAFDLWSYDDVKARATDILERLDNGSMPCDGAWPSERVEVFRRWVATDMPE